MLQGGSAAGDDEPISRQQLVDFYTNRDPSKIGNVDNILAQFGPAQIRQILMQKYGETITAGGVAAGTVSSMVPLTADASAGGIATDDVSDNIIEDDFHGAKELFGLFFEFG